MPARQLIYMGIDKAERTKYFVKKARAYLDTAKQLALSPL